MSDKNKELPEDKADNTSEQTPASQQSSVKTQSAVPNATPTAAKATQKSATAKAPKASQKSAAPKKQTTRGSKVPLIIAVVGLLLAIGVAGGGYWLWLQLEQMKTEQAADVAELQQALNQSNARLDGLQSQARDNSAWHKAIDDLEDLVTASAQRWNRQANRTDERWPLEEALTLTRLAQQRLQLDSSATVAVGLLKSADEILATLDQAAVLPLRRQLAADVLALETTSAADVNGYYFSLDAIGNQIRELDWLPQTSLQTDIPEDISPMQGFWHELKQVVVIQRLDVPMEAPALQSDFEFWRQHTLLLIEQIQLALLARNQSLYEIGLDQASAQLDVMASQFDVNVWQQSFTDLKASVLNPEWPDISASTQAIELYLSEQEDPDQTQAEVAQ